MAGANGVASHVHQHLQLTLQRAAVDGGAQRAQIMMVADAIELEMLAVDEEAIGIELQRADSKTASSASTTLFHVLHRRQGHVTVRLLCGAGPHNFGFATGFAFPTADRTGARRNSNTCGD